MKRILRMVPVLALALLPFATVFSQETSGSGAPAFEGNSDAAVPGEAGGTGGNRKDSDDLEMLEMLIEGNQGALIGSWSQARDLFWWGKGIDESLPVKPTRLPAVVGTPSGPVRMPVLRGVMIVSDRDRVAILGDSRVRAGDFCQGFQVRSIDARKVILTRDGKEYTLYVKE